MAITGGAFNTLLGNYIGTDVTGTAALPNGGDGVLISDVSRLGFSHFPGSGAGSANVIGGVDNGAGNRIAFNGGAGVRMENRAGQNVFDNPVRGNDIHDNGGLGIDLGAVGVTANDDKDPDGGTNLQQNFPILGGAARSAASISIGGFLNSKPNTTFTIDFYASLAADPSGLGEGRRYLGSTTTFTDPIEGNASFSFTLAPDAVAVGEVVTATATDPNGNTSEFSNALAVPASGVPATFQFSAAAPRVHENDGAAFLYVTRTGDLSGTAMVDFATADLARLRTNRLSRPPPAAFTRSL